MSYPELPELVRGEPRALCQTGQLRPDDVGVHGRLADPGAEPAIGPGDDVLATDQPRVAADPLGDQLRVLDEVRRRIEDAGDDELARGKLHALEHPPLVRVPRI